MKKQELIDLQNQVKEVMNQCPFVDDYRVCSVQGIKLLSKLENEQKALNIPRLSDLQDMLSQHHQCPLINAYELVVAKRALCRFLSWFIIFFL